MKKEYIEKIIEAKKTLKDFSHNPLRNFELEINDGNIVQMDEEKWFPKIKSLNEEFETLKKEIKEVISKKNEAKKFLYKEYKCNHCVKICEYNYRVNHYEDTCILCGETFFLSNINPSYTIRQINDKNKKCATFIGLENITPGGFMSDEEYQRHYTKKDIEKIILNILENTQEEDIDIVDEIEKLNLSKCIINKPHNKTLILIIIGTNKQYIENNNPTNYFTNKYYINTEPIIEYCKELYNTAIEIFGDRDSVTKYKTISEQIFLTNYDTIQYIEQHLNYEKDIQFNLIIDMSNLYEYKLENNNIEISKYKLDLKKLFPNIPIIKIEDCSKENLEEINELLSKVDSNTYAYNFNSYYHLQDNELKKENVNIVCNNIKKLIKR